MKRRLEVLMDMIGAEYKWFCPNEYSYKDFANILLGCSDDEFSDVETIISQILNKHDLREIGKEVMNNMVEIEEQTETSAFFICQARKIINLILSSL